MLWCKSVTSCGFSSRCILACDFDSVHAFVRACRDCCLWRILYRRWSASTTLTTYSVVYDAPCTEGGQRTRYWQHILLFMTHPVQKVVSEHDIDNIFCACQDGDDLMVFAYITRDLVTQKHYCHVFRVDSTVCPPGCLMFSFVIIVLLYNL